MKKEIKEIVTISGEKVQRITTLNERWYVKPIMSAVDGLPSYLYYPSSTWIAGSYPKGIAFYQWLAKHGWDEAEALKNSAGDKGSKVHYASEDIELGKEVKIDSKYINPSTGQEEELTIEEYGCIISFRDWLDANKPELIASEISSFNEKNTYAGTIDRIYRIGKQLWIVDLKTGQYIWPEHELQISSYAHLDLDFKTLKITSEEWKSRRLATLQIGYRRNKKKYKFTKVEDKFDLFLNAKAIWADQNPDSKPKEISYPLSIVSELRTKKVKKVKKITKK